MKEQKRFKTSLIALTQRYRPPALERIYIGPDGLLNAISKIFRMFVLKINWILRQGQAKQFTKMAELLLFGLLYRGKAHFYL